MVEWLRNLGGNPIVSSIGLLTGIVGLVATCWIAWWQRRLREPCWASTHVTLVNDRQSTVPGLAITYRSEAVTNLGRCELAFWNRGAETIRRDDIPGSDPLRLVARDGVRLLDVLVESATDPANEFSVTLAADGSRCAIDFLFLEHQQGARLSVLHTGTTVEDVALAGRVLGGRPLARVSALETGDPLLNLLLLGLVGALRRLVSIFLGNARSARTSELIARLLLAIAGAGFAGLIIYGWQQAVHTWQRLAEQPSWPGRVALLLAIGMVTGLSLLGYRLLQATARRVERRRTPPATIRVTAP